MNLEVEIADNGRMACEMAVRSKAEGRPYDLILMDIQMPIRNGYEATRWLHQRGWEGPIVALTAHALVGDREKCLAAGFDDYIPKPITARKLADLLTRYLDGPAAGGQRMPAAQEAGAEPAGLLESGFLDAGTAAGLLEAFAGELPARASAIDEALRRGICRCWPIGPISSRAPRASMVSARSPTWPPRYIEERPSHRTPSSSRPSWPSCSPCAIRVSARGRGAFSQTWAKSARRRDARTRPVPFGDTRGTPTRFRVAPLASSTSFGRKCPCLRSRAGVRVLDGGGLDAA